MTSKKIFLNPNNDFDLKVSRFWIAFSNWIQNDNFDFDLIDEKYCAYCRDEKTLDVNWENLYMEYLGKTVPFNIAMFNDADWEEIKEFVSIMFHYVVKDDKKNKFECKINEYLKRFELDNMFLKGEFVQSNFIVEQPSVKEILSWIDMYPDASKAYHSALSKLSDGIYARNAIDDMRLAFESLVRDLTGSTKTLENQIKPLGELLKGKGVSPHTMNMVTSMITFYTKYQNDYVKHHDAVDKADLELIVCLTVDIMKYLRERLV